MLQLPEERSQDSCYNSPYREARNIWFIQIGTNHRSDNSQGTQDKSHPLPPSNIASLQTQDGHFPALSVKLLSFGQLNHAVSGTLENLFVLAKQDRWRKRAPERCRLNVSHLSFFR